VGGAVSVADIKLFVCCHRQEEVPKHPLLCPIQVGAALAGARFPGFLSDDTGSNISGKNRSYCELTAQYWAWKNIRADYYGFFHYRRYLCPDRSTKYPYRVEREPTLELLGSLGYDAFPELIPQYDLILPRGENMHVPVRKHYADAPFHRGEDLALAEKIVWELSPEYAGTLDLYLSQTVCFFGNIYIMAKPVFEHYCAWLFPVLAEFDRRTDPTGRDPQERRADGYLAERLFGGFCRKVRAEGLRTLELPRVDFIPENGTRWRRKLLAAVLPPGTKRRAAVKRWSGNG